MHWKHITTDNGLKAIIETSNESPIIIFKHSTRCSVSFMAKKNLEWQLNDTIHSYLLDLLSYRSISNEIAAHFDVTHQSPQVLVIDKGSVIYHASHSDIDPEEINQLCSTI